MLCSKDAIFRCADAIFLAAIFLFQSVILNYFIINYYNKSSFPFLWFLGDFFCLLIFSFTLFAAYQEQYKRKRKERLQTSASNSSSFISNRANSRQGSEAEHCAENETSSTICHLGPVARLPFSYMSWIFYSIMIIAKLVVLVKADIPQTLKSDEFFGPALLKICIAVSSIIFYLLVEAHHDAHDDAVRYAYVNSISYSTAIEILDTTNFFALLLEQETGLMYSFQFENFILSLSSINIMLPSIALYKLSMSNFGRTYPVTLEVIYKVLHFLLINVSYCGVRLYLLNWYGAADTSVFLIKNVYSMITFFRGIYSDMKKLETEWKNKMNWKEFLQPFQNHGDLTISANRVTKAEQNIESGENIPMGKQKMKKLKREDDYNSEV